MNEMQKTMRYGGVALALMLLAFLTRPSVPRPDAFFDKGEPFYPNFTDPNTATSLEVIDYDEETGTAIPFKVQFKGGKWTIPSHHDYPADGKDRLAKTAASVIGVTKDDIRSDNVADHEKCGVIDPLDDEATSIKGRGKRVTIRGANDEVLADFIIGKEVEGSQGYRFVRVPGQKRVYAAKIDVDISTKFSDWIEADLLKASKDEFDQVVLRDYSVDERTGIVRQRDVLTLKKKDGVWTADKMRADQEVDGTKMNEILKTLDDLKIVGVRPKPAGLSESLSRISGGVELTGEDLASLRSKGYFFSTNGQLLSNEGEVNALTEDGVEYTLRFGEVVYGTGEAVSAGTGEDGKATGPAENRYLFITTAFKEKLFPEPEKPKNMEFQSKPDSLWTAEDRANKALQDAHDEWQQKIDKGKERSESLNRRFARWYYVIPSESFDKLNLTRKELVVKKKDD